MERYDVLPRRVEHTIHCPPLDSTADDVGANAGNGTGPCDLEQNPYPAFTSIALSVQYLATGTADGRIIIWPVSRRTPVDCIELGSASQRVSDLSWSPSGRFLFAVLSGNGEAVLRVWEVRAYGNENIAREIGSVSIKAMGDVTVEGCGQDNADGACGVMASRPGDSTMTPTKQWPNRTKAVTPVAKKRKKAKTPSNAPRGTTAVADEVRLSERALVTDVQGGGLYWLILEPSNDANTVTLSPITLLGWEDDRLVVGDRVEVFWKDNDPQPTWFAGSVGQVDLDRKRMLVFYDDGQALWEEWEGPEALEWRREAPGTQPTPSTSAPLSQVMGSLGGTSGRPTILAVRCAKRFDHLAVLDVPATTLRLYAKQGADTFRLVDELKTNNMHVTPSHIAASPNGRHLAVTHPDGNIVAYSVNTDDNVSSLESPNKSQHYKVMRLSMTSQLDWNSWKGKRDAKKGDRCHTWHACTFAPDSTHIFCSMTLDHEPKRHPIVIWDHIANVSRRLLESSNNGVPHVVTSMRAHPNGRPMELFALNTSGLVVIWASRLVQNWSVIEQGFESFEKNRLHIELEDDFDVVEGGPRVDEAVGVVENDELEID